MGAWPIFSWRNIKFMSDQGSLLRTQIESSESVNFYRKFGYKAELRTTKALTSQLQWMPTKYVHPCYSNWKLPKATAL